MEQILVRNLPEGTKALLKSRALKHNHSVEAEVRQILTETLKPQTSNLVDLISLEHGAEIDFEPKRLGLSARVSEL